MIIPDAAEGDRPILVCPHSAIHKVSLLMSSVLIRKTVSQLTVVLLKVTQLTPKDILPRSVPPVVSDYVPGTTVTPELHLPLISRPSLCTQYAADLCLTPGQGVPLNLVRRSLPYCQIIAFSGTPL